MVFVFVLFKGNLLTGIFTTDAAVVQNGYDYLKGFALETIVTAVLLVWSVILNGHDRTVWVMVQGLVTDPAGTSAAGILYEYSAGCKPYKDWFCSTCGNDIWYYFKCYFLCMDK